MKQDREITIVGISLRTSNNEAMETIPPLWGRFYGEGILEQVSNRISDEVYAVYTDFENEGLNNEGNYTLIIGVEVKDLDNIPKGLVTTTIKVQNREVFSVSEGKPENVGATWMDIWQRDDLKKTFISEYEHYHAEGIDVYIGVE
jgi:predicted transcriptional regulator YdeE